MLSKQAGCVIMIKPDQRTGIKMRPDLTYIMVVEEFQGSKCVPQASDMCLMNVSRC